MTNYKIGYYFERKALEELRKDGAIITGRSGGSKGIFDIWGIYANKVRFVQIKPVKGMAKNELKRMVELSRQIHMPSLYKEVWYYEKRKGFVKKVTIDG